MKTNSLRKIGLVFLVLAAGCSPTNPPATGPSSGKIVIRGSNTIGEELAPALITEYKKDHPGAEFDLECKGTSYGFGALAGGLCDISGASRPPSEVELEVGRMREVDFKDHVIGAYSVAVVVNAANAVANLSKEQVRDIFSGAITNWSAVGGQDAPIHLFIRDPISGTFLGFKELALDKKEYAPGPKALTNYEGIVENVGRDAGGIGYSSVTAAKNPGVKVVSIGGVAPGAESVNKGEYPYARKLHLFTSSKHETTGAMDFIQFVLSARGQKVLADTGDTPLTAANP